MSDSSVDLNLLYKTALAGIHRAYVFMRFGVQGVSVIDFEDTALPGRNQILIVPEPIPQDMLNGYLTQFRAWVIGNGLRELVETYCQFLDEVYAHGLTALSSPDFPRLQKTFEQASLREKVRRLREEMNIEGGCSHHFENFSAARNALTHGAGTVRRRDYTDGDALAITWQGIEAYFLGDDGNRYRVGDEPQGMQLREPIESIIVDRERRWKLGQRVILSATDLVEICFMTNYDSINILNALREFGLRHNVRMTAATIVRGGDQDDES